MPVPTWDQFKLVINLPMLINYNFCQSPTFYKVINKYGIFWFFFKLDKFEIPLCFYPFSLYKKLIKSFRKREVVEDSNWSIYLRCFEPEWIGDIFWLYLLLIVACWEHLFDCHLAEELTIIHFFFLASSILILFVKAVIVGDEAEKEMEWKLLFWMLDFWFDFLLE